MSEPFVFDPRCEVCKSPFGAVPCGGTVVFHLRPLASEGFSHCALVLRREFAGTTEERELCPDGAEAERFRFSLSLPAPAEPELIWYHFRFWREDGSGCVLDRTGYRSDGQLDSWQLTVYEPRETPKWFGAGVTYQIFPDRFFRQPGPAADPAGLVGDRWVHQDWHEEPVWRPDPDGEVRNRDFFGGTLEGIRAKLPYLASLGVTTLYLCPIFESASNHRYNTADYRKIDPLLGTEADFRALAEEARQLGIRVMLDGVFNHTGSQSLYFNADGFYPTLGAAQSRESPYYDWFSFHPWPDDYDSWWGIRTLPAVREDCQSYVNYVIDDPDSIIRHWLRVGASGWRLDVADELPDWFIQKLRAAVEKTGPDNFLLGEVWEDASTKVAYSERRKYLLGRELHGVMNYPFRTALLGYLQGGDSDVFREAMEALRENYPPDAYYAAMNFLGTHDTPRILTVLGANYVPESKEARAAYRLSPDERARGLALVRLAALVLFTFPGSPTVYYGDEVGMEGWEDPFNRGTYPWDGGDQDLLAYFTKLGQLRQSQPALQTGSISYLYTAGTILAYARELADQRLVPVIHSGPEPVRLTLSWPRAQAEDLLTGRTFLAENSFLTLDLPPRSGLLLR